MLSPNLYDLQRVHLDDLLRAAKASRHHVPQEKITTPIYGLILAKLGEKLVVVGETLQHRYGELVEVETFSTRNTSSSVGC